VQISLARFNNIVINENSGTVEIGAGLTWTDVYASIVPKGINVVGGRLNGVGVSGLTLGGGERFACPGTRRGSETVPTRQDTLGRQTNLVSL
jgi:hypothetical protein